MIQRWLREGCVWAVTVQLTVMPRWIHTTSSVEQSWQVRNGHKQRLMWDKKVPARRNVVSCQCHGWWLASLMQHHCSEFVIGRKYSATLGCWRKSQSFWRSCFVYMLPSLLSRWTPSHRSHFLDCHWVYLIDIVPSQPWAAFVPCITLRANLK